MKQIIKTTLVAGGVCLASLAITACSGNGTAASGGGVVSAPVSVSVMTTVPVINGNLTSGSLFINNTSGVAVNNLVATVVDKSSSSSVHKVTQALRSLFGNGLQSNDSGFTLTNPHECETIKAGGSCTLNFTTPNLSPGEQGSAVVNISYTANGISSVTNSVVNYEYIASDLANSGVHFVGNAVNDYTPQGKSNYVVGYLYATGEAGAKYKTYLKANNPGMLVVSQGFTGLDESSAVEVGVGQVIPVQMKVNSELSAKSTLTMTPYYGAEIAPLKANKKALSAKSLTTISWIGGTPFTVSLTPEVQAVNFIFSSASNLSYDVESTLAQKSTSITALNNGNIATSSAMTAAVVGSGLTITPSSCASLAANAQSTCVFALQVTAESSGSAVVNFSYGGATVGSQTVTWVNRSSLLPVITITPNTNLLNLAVGSSQDVTYTIANIGTTAFNNPTVSFNTQIQAAAKLEKVSSTCGSSLAKGASCSYIYKVTALTDAYAVDTSAQSIRMSLAGTDSNGISYSYSQNPGIGYTFGTPMPIFSISPATWNAVIQANGTESAEQAFVVTNGGSGDGTLSAINLISDNTNLKPQIISGGTCNTTSSIAPAASCTILVKYGPAPFTESQNQTGTATLTVDYIGAGAPVTSMATITYTLAANDSFLAPESIVAVNMSGSGTSDSQFIAQPSNGGMSVVITFTNKSANYTMTKLNLNTESLPYGLTVSNSSTCPYGSATGSLESGVSCHLDINVDTALLRVSPNGAQNVLNFTLPSASWQTTLGVYKQAGSLFEPVYMNYTQPSVSFSTAYAPNGSSNQAIVTATALNASTGNDINVNVSGVKSYLSVAPTSSGCGSATTDWGFICDLKTNPVVTLTYTLPIYLSSQVPVLYTTSSTATLSPQYSLLQYPTAASWNDLNLGYAGNNVAMATIAGGSAPNVYIVTDSGDGSLNVSNYSGSAWINLGQVTTTGSSPAIALDIDSSFNVTPYVAYIDTTTNKIVVKKYTGSGWSFVGANGLSSGTVTSIAIGVNTTSHTPVIAFDDNTLGGKAVVESWNSTASAWENVGSSISSGQASSMALFVNGSTTNVGFIDAGAPIPNQAIIKAKGESSTSFIPVGTVSTGAASKLVMTGLPGGKGLYAAFSDATAANKATVVNCNNGVCSSANFGNAGGASSSAVTSLGLDSSSSGEVYLSTVQDGILSVEYNSGGNWTTLGSGFLGSGIVANALVYSITWEMPFVAYSNGSSIISYDYR